MRKLSLSALAVAGLLVGGFSAGSASAADLGGNCCADLEERIAELEATTARKGNRKVSLTISGWVAEQVMWWDDGDESNVYVIGLGTTLASNVKFTGSAQISPGWSAGYVVHMELIDSDSLTIDQSIYHGPAVYTGSDGDVTLLQSFWFLKSDHLGKVSIGLQSQASDNTAILVDGSGSLVPANWVAFDTNSFALRFKDGTLSGFGWGSMGSCRGMGGAWGDCNGLTTQSVRYDSPTWHGFSVSASWGEDDFWDVAARYAGEFGGFKVAAAAAYNEVTRQDEYNPSNTAIGNDLQYFQAGVYVQHVPTGLWILGNYGWLDQDGVVDNVNIADEAIPDTDTWYIKAGLRERWHPLGHTVIWGEYLNNDDGAVFQCNAIADENTATEDLCDKSDLQVWGVGILQEIDAAAMSIWLSYRHLDGDVTGCENCDEAGGFEDFQYIKFGALINF